jgi:TFIIH basal transcription factor complex TTD-A subunit
MSSKTTPKKSPTNTTKRDATDKNLLPPCAGYLITCDVPTKQFIQYLNDLKPVDKKFIIRDLDATHLLVKRKAREEITRKVEEWLDENVFSAVEKVGEDFDVS